MFLEFGDLFLESAYDFFVRFDELLVREFRVDKLNNCVVSLLFKFTLAIEDHSATCSRPSVPLEFSNMLRY